MQLRNQPVITANIMCILAHPDPYFLFGIRIQVLAEVVDRQPVVNLVHELLCIVGRSFQQLPGPFPALLVAFRSEYVGNGSNGIIILDDAHLALHGFIQSNGFLQYLDV